MSPTELYAHHFQDQEPKFYTRIPNIIDHLTYQIDEGGTKKTKRLSVYAKELYRIIRLIASDHNKDWHTTEQLAEMMNCSVGAIVNAKKELMQSMDQLDGNPLIVETRKMVSRVVDNKPIKITLCTRTIVPIWGWNNAFMATLNSQNKFGSRPDSCGESAIPPDSCGESAPQGPDSCGEPNNITCNNNPLSKEQQPAAPAASVCSLNSQDSVFGSQPTATDVKTKAFNWLVKLGCDIKTALSITERYSVEEISLASMYVHKQFEKYKKNNKVMGNVIGYFRKTLENKWWIGAQGA